MSREREIHKHACVHILHAHLYVPNTTRAMVIVDALKNESELLAYEASGDGSTKFFVYIRSSPLSPRVTLKTLSRYVTLNVALRIGAGGWRKSGKRGMSICGNSLRLRKPPMAPIGLTVVLSKVIVTLFGSLTL
mmetsp:Transcript_27048/g.37758  ORF Transcript_27048/g.37758 Transcript_27048/m.37758 type:complete len:134 (-) Transcript_27048:521-922(-)